ncbi:hypothetical protein HRF90_03815 [Klebsiella michiganensis]|uniref:FidL-like protein n=2 Tax=Klebsiella pasteurii TaxID=2587529 RepID=UPI00155F5675|nr:hypothetical protein [Klebsiella michiganensis]
MKVIFSMLIILSFFVFLCLFSYFKEPFICNSFLRQEINQGNKMIYFNAYHSIMIDSYMKGDYIISGEVLVDGKKFTMSRKIHLKTNRYVFNNRFKIKTSGISKSMVDNTPDYVFNKMYAEIVPDGKSVYLQLTPIGDNLFVLNSALSSFLVCVKK